MASAESVAAVIEAGGAHVPELMERLEARLAELARSHGAVLAEQHDEWAEGRRYLGLDIITRAQATTTQTEEVTDPDLQAISA